MGAAPESPDGRGGRGGAPAGHIHGIDAPRRLPRSLAALAALAAGFLIARHLPDAGIPAVAWFSIASGACAVAGAARGRWCAAALMAAAVAFGAGWFTLRIWERPAGSLSRLLDAGGSPIVTVEGVLLEDPRRQRPEAGPLAPPLFLEARTLARVGVRFAGDGRAMPPASGVLNVRAGAGALDGLRAGDGVRLTGNLTAPPAPANPGQRDRRLIAAQEHLVGALRIPSRGLVEPLAGISRLGPLLRLRADLRAAAHRVLLGGNDPPGEPGRALVGALVLGAVEPGLEEVRPAFLRVGMAHILAISGFHVAVMAWVALVLVRVTGDRGWLEPALVAAALCVYLLIVPAQAPIVRAGTMVLILLAAEASGRRYDPLALLGWIAVGVLVWRPMDLWSIGFQLSFGLVGVLMWLGSHIHASIFGPRIATGMPGDGPGGLGGVGGVGGGALGSAIDYGRRLFSANVACVLVATPIVAYHTGLVSPLAILAGVVIVPPVVLLLGVAYAALLVGILAPGGAPLVSGLLESAAPAVVGLVTAMDALPGASFCLPRLSLAWCIAGTLAAVFWLVRGRLLDRAALCAVACVALWLGAEVVYGPRLASGVELRIDTLSVGDGTCHLLRARAQDGRTEAMLWDCGSLTMGVGRTIVPRALRELGAWKVRRIVISHADLDHFNALLDIAGPLGVREVLVGRQFMDDARSPRGPEGLVLAELAAMGISVRIVGAGDSIALGDARLEFLWPPHPPNPHPPNPHPPNEGGAGDGRGPLPTTPNDLSLVALATTPSGGRLLMTGDIQGAAMRRLLEDRRRLRAEVAEAPHHGSAPPPGHPAYEFIDAIAPGVVLQSTGPRRAYDERWNSRRVGRAWYTTAAHGAAWVELRRDGAIAHGALRD